VQELISPYSALITKARLFLVKEVDWKGYCHCVRTM